ncbi:MAG: hypothetical protein E7511_06850 [Ruminococcus sp.]|nr:hypothetical protein [Ruminococcus sp.]
MKKKTIIIIGAVIAVVIAGSVGAVIWGRSNRLEETNSDSDTSQVQESSEQETLSAEQMGAFQIAIEKTIEPEDAEETEVPLFLESLRNAYSFEVISINPLEAKDTYQGTVRLTYADAADAIKTYMNENSNVPFDEEKLNRDIAELVSNAELVTEECEMYFVKNGEELQPVFTEEIIDKMYGGIYSGYYEKLDEFAESMKEGE